MSKVDLETSICKEIDESPAKVKSNGSVSGDENQEKLKKPEKPLPSLSPSKSKR